MDNVTHSLIGVALGAVVMKAVPKLSELPKTKRLVMWTCILSNNAPDIDVFLPRLFPSVFGGGKLAMLLEHRGFTHTVTAAPVLAAICLALAWLLSGMPRIYKSWWKWFYALGILGVLCHLGADFCNDYGVHPFSPFSNHWYYGDFLFIVEPLIWFSILPLAYQEARGRLLKGLAVLIASAMALMLIFGPYAPPDVAFFVLIWAGIALQWQRWVRGGRWTWLPSISLVALVILFFFNASKIVRKDLAEIILKNHPGEQIVQLIRTPAPSNPVCWKVLIVTEGPDDRYTIRTAAVSLFPKMISPSSCLRGIEYPHTADLVPVSLPVGTSHGAEISWGGEYRRARSEIGYLDSQFCQFKALREFARAPFWANDRQGWVAGDLRYDRSGGRGFTDVQFATPSSDTPCPNYLPGWDPPVPE